MSLYSSSQSPFIGKYLYVADLESSPYGETWGFQCYCVSFNNGVYTVRNKVGKEFKASINQIKNVIDITETQQFRIGDVVEAKVDYCQWDADWIIKYCQVLSVKNFCNDFDYVVKCIESDKPYDLTQNSIVKVVTLLQATYQVGAYVGVNTYVGPQWDMEIVVKNGTINKVKNWYNRVTYEITYDTGEIDTTVYENNITNPEVVKTKQQIPQQNMEFLRNEEERLLRQLEIVRAARNGIQ
jgi:hypothetical protein